MEAIVAMAELLMAAPLDPNQARYVGTMHQSARGLLGVLADILDFARLEAGRFELEPTSFDLHDLIQGVGSVLQARTNEKGLTGGLDIGANCPQFVTGDPRPAAPGSLEPHRQRAQIHRPRFDPPACERK